MIKVTRINKDDVRPDGTQERFDAYRVMLKGWLVDVVKAEEGWGTLPVRRTTDKPATAKPKGPFGSKDEMIALAGYLISQEITSHRQ